MRNFRRGAYSSMNLGIRGRITSASVSGPRKRGPFSRVAQAREKQLYAALGEALVSIRRVRITITFVFQQFVLLCPNLFFISAQTTIIGMAGI
jgi:hypothetical protein